MCDIGISRAYQRALIDTMDELIAAPGIDHEVARHAVHLKGALGGYEPKALPDFLAPHSKSADARERAFAPRQPCSRGAEPQFVTDAPPLVRRDALPLTPLSPAAVDL